MKKRTIIFIATCVAVPAIIKCVNEYINRLGEWYKGETVDGELRYLHFENGKVSMLNEDLVTIDFGEYSKDGDDVLIQMNKKHKAFCDQCYLYFVAVPGITVLYEKCLDPRYLKANNRMAQKKAIN